MTDAKTIAFYNSDADRYAHLTQSAEPDADLRAFLAMLPPGGRVLDLGCGPGQAAAHMAQAGFDPDPVDAAQSMVDIARNTHGLNARLMSFDALDVKDTYDGIWANFSLLHAARHDLPDHLAAIATALRPGGAFHIGMKTGAGEARDAINRRYTYVTVPELSALLTDAGFAIQTTREGREKGCAGTLDPYVIIKARKHG